MLIRLKPVNCVFACEGKEQSKKKYKWNKVWKKFHNSPYVMMQGFCGEDQWKEIHTVIDR